MVSLTDRQRQVLEFIQAHKAEHGFMPTLREIGQHMGIKSTNGVNDHLNALQRKGYIERSGMMSRAMRVLVPGKGSPAPDLTDAIRRALEPYIVFAAKRTGDHEQEPDIARVIAKCLEREGTWGPRLAESA